MRRLALLSVAAVVVLLAASCQKEPGPQRITVSMAIAARMTADVPSAHPRSAWLAEEVHRFYDQRNNAPAWSDGRAPRENAHELVELLMKSGRDGIDSTVFAPSAMGVAMMALKPTGLGASANPESLARLDIRFTRAALRYVHLLHDGKIPAAVLDSDWVALRDTIDAVAVLAHAIKSQKLAEGLDAAAPKGNAYRALRAARDRMLEIEAAGGWPELPAGPPLAKGAQDGRVPVLRQRLAVEGLLKGAEGDAFDAPVEIALKSFQSRHGLPPSGKVDDRTRAMLNRTPASWAKMLAMNMERRHWVPESFAEPCVVVNLPAFHLDVHDSGRVVLDMKVVIGAKRNPTPVFSDTITYLELNPTWRLPKRIIVEEMLPALKKDPEHFAKQNMKVLYTRGREYEEVRADSINWAAVESDSFPFLVRQDAGPDNPLGRIKFMCPNEYDVYLHDTPSTSLFASDARARSHGCVRVQKPMMLAERLLTDQPQALEDSLNAIFASGIRRRITLKRKMPVHLMYWTAWVDDHGVVQYRDDLYGIDDRIADAIASGRPRDFVLNPELIWGSKKEELAKAARAQKPRSVPAKSSRGSGH